MKFSIEYMLILLIAVLFFVAVFPDIMAGTTALESNENVTGASATMIGLIGLIIVVVFILSIYKGRL